MSAVVFANLLGLISGLLGMSEREAKIKRIKEALSSASDNQLTQICQVLHLRTAKRTLSEALEEEERIANALELSDRHKARRVNDVLSSEWKVAAQKTSARFAITEITNKSPLYHVPLFLLTILIRTMYGSCPALRKHALEGSWELRINGDYLYRSCLNRKLYDQGLRHIVGSSFFNGLTRVIAMMHCHSFVAKWDSLHMVLKRALPGHSELAKLARISFHYNFSFLRLFETKPVVLEELFNKGPTAFAKHCWTHHIIPVTNRYGQGTDTPKTIFSVLLRCAQDADEDLFTEKVVMQRKRCLTLAECGKLLLSMAKPAVNRMKVLIDFYASRPGEGIFTVKNMAECMSAQQLIKWKPEEMALLPDGQGAARFWKSAGLGGQRQAFMKEAKDLFGKIRHVDAVFNNRTQRVKLDLQPGHFQEESGQFWACAESRILRLQQKLDRRAGTVVPLSLLPNRKLLEIMNNAWSAGTSIPDDSGSDSDIDE